MPYLETIAAIASPLGVGGIGVIRISGSSSLAILEQIFSRNTIFSSHHLYHGWIRDPQTGENIDEVMVAWMQAPHSYTGEDVVEISGHGNPCLLNQILQLIFSLGATPAEPGEFTKRAFLNGKLNLSQAEAIHSAVTAKSVFGVRGAISALSGAIIQLAADIRERILSCLAQLESTIDFSDDIGELNRERFLEGLVELRDMLRNAIRDGASFSSLHSGIKVVLLGMPNVGKSSLLNAIVGKNRAIVTEIPGTTRDTVEGEFQWNDLTFSLIDTAGWRETDELVEREGIMRSEQLIEAADILIVVLDQTRSLRSEDIQLLMRTHKKKGVIVLNKSDLECSIDIDEVRKHTSFAQIVVSAISGENIHKLKQLVADIALATFDRQISDHHPILLNDRQTYRFQRTLDSIQRAIDAVSRGDPEDCISIDLKEGAVSLDEISGEGISGEVIDRIFSGFCVGK